LVIGPNLATLLSGATWCRVARRVC